MIKPSTATANGLLNGTGLKEQLDGGKLFIYAGPVPATADDALDMVEDHTLVAIITESDDGATGLTFEDPDNGILAKKVAETWLGETDFDGADDSDPTLVCTFFRFCADGDNGQGAADSSTGYRLQGTIGGPNSGADMVRGNPEVAEAQPFPIGSFAIRIPVAV